MIGGLYIIYHVYSESINMINLLRMTSQAQAKRSNFTKIFHVNNLLSVILHLKPNIINQSIF